MPFWKLSLESSSCDGGSAWIDPMWEALSGFSPNVKEKQARLPRVTSEVDRQE